VAIAELKSSLAAFATFARSLKGDEKSEAQSFLDHFFRALGHPSAIAAGATFEFRIAKKPGSSQLELLKGESAVKAKGGKKYGDLVWPGRVLIEMKSRGENLEKHYDQLFDYWTHIVPRKPAYAILCNFDEFWIYEFNTQLFDPVDRVLLRDLADSSSTFNFLLPVAAKPIFENKIASMSPARPPTLSPPSSARSSPAAKTAPAPSASSCSSSSPWSRKTSACCRTTSSPRSLRELDNRSVRLPS
jgi:hypothetical protein